MKQQVRFSVSERNHGDICFPEFISVCFPEQELKEDLEAEDPDDPNVDKLLRDLSSFRKLFKLLFSDVPPGWTPAAPPKKVSKFVVD